MRKSLLTLVLAGLGLIPQLAEAQSISDSDLLWVEPLVTVIPDGTLDTSFTVAIMIHSTTKIVSLDIPLSFAGHPSLRIDTTVLTTPDIRGVTFGPAGRSSDWTIKTSNVDNDNQTIGVFFFNFASGADPLNDTLCYLHFSLDASGQAGSITLDSTMVEGIHLNLTDALANAHIPTWTPGVISIFATGDVDCDGEINTTDIIYMVNFMFRQGPAPMSGCQ